MRRRRACFRLSPVSASRLRLCLLISSIAWVVLVYSTLVYLTTKQEELLKRNNLSHIPSPHKLQGNTKGVPSRQQEKKKQPLPVQIFVQEHVDSSWRITNASLPRRLDDAARNVVVDCHEPYRSIPQLLDIDQDPFLPWIHDYFVTTDNTQVRFVAQNKRRCYTGKNRKDVMAFWEPQMALLQPISAAMDLSTHRYYLTEPEHAHYPETRFMCRFHDNDDDDATQITTLSTFPFNYEYLNWRKRVQKPMFVKDGPDVEIFDYATLLFSCPIPKSLRGKPNKLFLDVAPIRTPARYDQGYLLTAQQVGEVEFAKLHRFDVVQHYGNNSLLPKIIDMGRIANLPVCPPRRQQEAPRRHTLVGCVWVAASYARRGGRSSVSDTPLRMREWLAFHQLAGYSHIYVYDNTQVDDDGDDDDDEEEEDENQFVLKNITTLFPGFATWIRWPAKVCNNNFAGGRWPGERSSQYAAEASCRERFGPQTEFMSFMDIDEYFVPIANDTWGAVLESKGGNSPVIGLRESRTRPLREMMEETHDEKTCSQSKDDATTTKGGEAAASCLVPRSNQTFLSIYNCDSVKPPRPRGYRTNMKQIYRPDTVLSHFVHYSVALRNMAAYYKDQADPANFSRPLSFAEKGLSFFNELTEATMIHARSVLPYETANWQTGCVSNSLEQCKVGIPCSDSTEYVDKLVDKNAFVDEQGNYCNCWKNPHVEKWIPKLEAALRELG